MNLSCPDCNGTNIVHGPENAPRRTAACLDCSAAFLLEDVERHAAFLIALKDVEKLSHQKKPVQTPKG